MVAEAAVAESFLFERLSALAVPVYSGAGPEDAEYPFCVFAFLAAGDRNTVEGTRVFVEMDYTAFIADRNESWTTLLTQATLLDGLLHRQRGIPAVGGEVLSCQRQEPFVQREPPVDGVTILNLGGVYRLLVSGG